MLELELDAEGYPTEETLTAIASYKVNGESDCALLLNTIRSIWAFAPNYWSSIKGVYEISTAGWSGNESIIEALQNNVMFWLLCWESSRRGGHFVFKLPSARRD